MVVIGWMEFAYAKLMRYKREARTAWIKIDAMLKARSTAALSLLEDAEKLGILEPEMAEIFELDGGYTQEGDREKASEYAEKVTPHLYSLMEKFERADVLRDEVQEILEMDLELEKMATPYNGSVRAHNDIIGLKKYKYQIALLKPDMLRDFQLKRELKG